MDKINKVAVIGSGVMGSGIAAHLANAQIETLLFDIVPNNFTEEDVKLFKTKENPLFRNKFALFGIENAKKIKPAAFYSLDLVKFITPYNLEDHFQKLAEVDWIIEVVIENLDIKKTLFKKIDSIKKPTTIVSSNTSGIPLGTMCDGLSNAFKENFLGTHFFNPPRYMKLLEIIPTNHTKPEVINLIAQICEKILGKGIVYAKDTPNFIANRIGMFSMMSVLRHMLEGNYLVEEVDKITGPAIGRPKSASFRTLDLVGIDTFYHVSNNLHDILLNDESKDIFKMPDFIKKMVENKWLGDKTGCGFYKKIKNNDKTEILVLDYNTLEYKAKKEVKFASLEQAKNIEDTRTRIKTLVFGQDRANIFAWNVLSDTMTYSANRLGEIADDVLNIDNAMKWGFNWKLGPFEMWDSVGIKEVVAKLEKENRKVPEICLKLIKEGKNSFYEKNQKFYYFNKVKNNFDEYVYDKNIIKLSNQTKIIKKNPESSLIDIGDGVICLEFHSKMNAIGGGIIQMLNFALTELEKNYDGMIISNEAENFSVGANLMMVLLEAQEGNWDEIDLMVKAFQKANMSIKYAPKPVCVAPFGLTLGGGCEITLHGSRVCAFAETYMGLVEVGVGVIPAGGGTKEMLVRALDAASYTKEANVFPFVKKAFETMGMAKVATSSYEAKFLGYLKENDLIVMNKDYLISNAKKVVQNLTKEGYKKQKEKNDIIALGKSAQATFKMGLFNMKEANFISSYDMLIGEKLAYILCGGNVNTGTLVSEQYILDLEREMFLALCGEQKTRERMSHMLKTGKPLRN
jgi:3-hydroxyacyl-CoA dehydrogenase